MKFKIKFLDYFFKTVVFAFVGLLFLFLVVEYYLISSVENLAKVTFICFGYSIVVSLFVVPCFREFFYFKIDSNGITSRYFFKLQTVKWSDLENIEMKPKKVLQLTTKFGKIDLLFPISNQAYLLTILNDLAKQFPEAKKLYDVVKKQG